MKAYLSTCREPEQLYNYIQCIQISVFITRDKLQIHQVINGTGSPQEWCLQGAW